uniref:FBA_2 domain-containing protein n=1 Tax=Caenorhabditis tropicalis TaxID=1561998 RepID=A0A1I7SYJ7_9PELO
MDGWLELLDGIKVASDWTVNFIYTVHTKHLQLKFIVEDVIQPLQASQDKRAFSYRSIMVWVWFCEPSIRRLNQMVTVTEF